MKAAEYPQKTCREPLFSASGNGYACELPLMHLGPCGNFSAADSVERRDAWEAQNPEHAEGTETLLGDVIVDSTGKATP